MKARRYQLRKDAVAIARRGHPWIFREQMSTAATALQDGDWLRLVDGQNAVVGYGIYESEGAIAIRMLRTGPDAPNAAWLRDTLAASVAKREGIESTGVRLVHGESDGIPAVVVDQFGDTAVVASYSPGADGLARYVASSLRAPNVMLRPARRRRGPAQEPRTLRGSPPEVVTFDEHGQRYAVDLVGGHKTGTYLDLRGLRRTLGTMNLAGKRVLNTFAYTGMLGRACEAAGAASITHVDASDRALAFAAQHHVVDASKHQFVTADVFEWLPEHTEQYDLVICDPPSMTSKKGQVPNALAAYRKLYRAAEKLVTPGGLLVSACCTSRIERKVFHQTVRASLPGRFKLELDIPPEPDHPVGFPQADYLKILVWRAT